LDASRPDPLILEKEGKREATVSPNFDKGYCCACWRNAAIVGFAFVASLLLEHGVASLAFRLNARDIGALLVIL